jgi:hypothetical protein
VCFSGCRFGRRFYSGRCVHISGQFRVGGRLCVAWRLTSLTDDRLIVGGCDVVSVVSRTAREEYVCRQRGSFRT